MKFIHTADWHLGKLVHGIYMTEEQRVILNQFVQLVEEEKPDAVIIAGDLYDRSVPPTDAVELLDEVLYSINVELQTPILAISGNHDSAERLSFGSSWYKNSQFYMQGKLTNDFQPIRLNGANFYLIPYAEPGIVRELLDDPSIHSHDEAMKSVIGRIEEGLNTSEPNVFIGHAFVLGGKTTESERMLSVGGSGCVSQEYFEPFSYTALGHLHSPDAIHHDRIRYSGSLLKYSFSEAKQKKQVLIVEMDDKGNVQIETKSLVPKRDMRELEGYMDELLDASFYTKQNVEDYLKITLLDEDAIIDPMGKLRQIYPNVLHLERKIEQKDLKEKRLFQSMKSQEKNELLLFKEFYREVTTAQFTEEKEKWLASMIDEVKRESLIK
ncbi:exonuclease SbcCD subunit D [Bacillus ginsengihumi]|uniref:Nuclease SbcCD subunit D n=1 Tax=Heyndrickxia ginsengihumi TaxID=363870 RepID=A0A6M0P9B3_9BACI|nr:exonuclease SbcCD subunit D [Heyndrickxia ginsengihumi]MBE6183120.1 exonuclease SbcCD subunit D [Bacillus sp. (in: firmicutes)]NEY20579.1 exonuclease SbcCD subunit D [Heyndrickxia ginsengihumi]